MLKTPLKIGTLTLPHRLIQGPLAGFSCAPMREQFSGYLAPAYCVSEMVSAQDVLMKHKNNSRYLYRSPKEQYLAYQIAGTEPLVMAKAALKLADFGAQLIDINCGCPKTKIRKKGAGSALLENPERLYAIVSEVRNAIAVPLTIKIRLQNNERDFLLVERLEKAGADALIVHGRHWRDDYDIPVNYSQIGLIQKTVGIPVIANGDLRDAASLQNAVKMTACAGYMIARAATGAPWFYQMLLEGTTPEPSIKTRIDCFLTHLQALEGLESEFSAVLQSKTLVRYYFREWRQEDFLKRYYTLDSLKRIEAFLRYHQKTEKNLMRSIINKDLLRPPEQVLGRI